ncbi:protein TRIGALACTOSYLDIACYLGLYCEROL 3, chloroplastic isoform X2 [Capsicum annuum]|uniref:protein TRIGALACTOSYLDIACYLGLYCEROL 3, chloroplastic isoform X2 n=1 Tax=Capsicum annuum TaxID=4072 RepID=UPI001FB052B2|nr:protein TRIGALACTOSYLDIACYLGLYCEROL 3, chloroplastic isoform X2 [Capsicum annuum]
MGSFVGSVMLPAVNICKSSSGSSSSSSSSYMKTFLPNSNLEKQPFLVTNRKNKGTVCACVAPPREYKAADSDRFQTKRFNESAKSENVSLLREPEDESDVLIECRNVCKSFGDKHILRGVSLKIRHGEAVGIIGPSGTGKSTILKIMAGLLAPDKGEVLIRGKLRNGLVSDEEISGLRIGLVFQSGALFDSLTVRENVGFLLYENSNMPEDQIAQFVTETLAAVGLKEVEDRLPSELSGGMKKRVALARSIIFDTTKDVVEPESECYKHLCMMYPLPISLLKLVQMTRENRKVLLYDEPTAGLDPIASTVVEDLIRSVHVTGEDALGKPGKIASYVVVTHQHSTIKRAVDRLIFLYEGKVVWQGMTHEFSTSANPIVRQFASGSLDGPIRY